MLFAILNERLSPVNGKGKMEAMIKVVRFGKYLHDRGYSGMRRADLVSYPEHGAAVARFEKPGEVLGV